jgi:molybdate transport system substrate-binding protein
MSERASRLKRAVGLLGIISVVLLTLSCAERATETTVRREVIVGAASSMAAALKACEASFEKEHPEIDIQLHFAASGTLVQQLSNGAPVEVVIFADRATLERAREASVVITDERTVATNTLALVTPKGVIGVTSSSGLAAPSVKTICIGNPAFVPLGRYTKAALKELGLWAPLKSKFVFANSASQARQYVERAEVDAAFLYGSDMATVGDDVMFIEELTGIAAPEYIAGLVGDNPGEGPPMLFLDYVSSSRASEHFRDYGFKPAPQGTP